MNSNWTHLEVSNTFSLLKLEIKLVNKQRKILFLEGSSRLILLLV